MHAAGFETCKVIEVAQTWRLGSVDELWRALAEGTVRTRALLRAQTTDATTKIRDAIRAGMSPYQNAADGFEIPMPAILASGVRP